MIDHDGNINPYRKEGIGFGINYYSIIESLISEYGIKPAMNILYNTDLRAPGE